MGKIRCKGDMCVDEETGRVFFIPSKECDPKSYAKVKEESTNEGISFTKLLSQREQPEKIKKLKKK